MSAIILVTGGFDPIHSGHIAYFRDAKEFNPSVPLCVGLNSDEWLIRKKGKYFLPMTERRAIVRELKPVDLTITCLLYTSPSPRDGLLSRMPSSA